MSDTHQNIELKVRCADLGEVWRRAVAIGASPGARMAQRDTFFAAPHARLKLREVDGRGELIAYRRPDTAEAKSSRYVLAKTEEPAELADVLALALGTRSCVVKMRYLLLLRHTRIHLDTVEQLGTFVELETVVSDQTLADARQELTEIAAALGLDRMESVPVAYVDLLEGRGEHAG